jgi:sulfofructose kinase
MRSIPMHPCRPPRPLGLQAFQWCWTRPDPQRLLAVIDFTVVSRSRAEELRGTGSPVDGLEKRVKWGARLAVVTCGEQGVLARAGDRTLEAPSAETAVRDSTGAGDAFHAGFIWGLLQGWPDERVLWAATAVAALACRALGEQRGMLGVEELEAALAASTVMSSGDDSREE